MKERPILFSAPMVRAILKGRKTQTRRIMKKLPCQCNAFEPEEMPSISPEGWQMSGHSGRWWCQCCTSYQDAKNCPYGQPGDRLWVRETWRLYDSLVECACYDACKCSRHHGKPLYRASLPDNEGPWKPSIHMPRWASRITLEVVSVRVERLQDISRGDCIAEGCPLPNISRITNVVAWYRSLWETINGPGSWAANPWVWVVEFKVMKGGVRSE